MRRERFFLPARPLCAVGKQLLPLALAIWPGVRGGGLPVQILFCPGGLRHAPGRLLCAVKRRGGAAGLRVFCRPDSIGPHLQPVFPVLFHRDGDHPV